LDVRGPDGDFYEQISAVVAAHAGDDDAAWLAYWADPDVVLLTMTITEAGYRAGSAIARIVAGLNTRWRADAGPMTLIPCDNLPHNGQVLADLVIGLATQVDPELPAWIAANVGFVSTAVDRITPATTEDDVARIASAVGWRDAVPVVTERFSEWVLLLAALLTGGVTMPSNRPDWTAILYLALGATCFGLVLQAWSQSHLSATTAAVIMTLEPAWAGAIAVVIGGEVLTLRMWIGAALILAAMFIAEFGPRGKRDVEVPWVEPV
jgi:uncharacterized membrane protein